MNASNTCLSSRSGRRKCSTILLPGFYHLLIFYGFLVVSLRTVSMVIEGFFAGWELPLLHTPIGHAYLFSKDIFELLVLIGLAFALWRRTVQKKERVINSFGAFLVVGLIGGLMITDLASEGARIAGGAMNGSFLPVSSVFGSPVQRVVPEHSSVDLFFHMVDSPGDSLLLCQRVALFQALPRLYGFVQRFLCQIG